MDIIKNFANNIVDFFKKMGPVQKMQAASSIIMLIGGSALAFAASQTDEEIIDITDTAEVVESDIVDDNSENTEIVDA